jgi:hexosaminidase
MVYEKEIKMFSDGQISAAAFDNGLLISPLYQQSFSFSKSTGRNIVLSVLPNKSYNNGGAFTLVDGILGRIPWYGKEWLGFLDDQVDVTINLAGQDSISEVRVDLLSAPSSWIYLPEKIDVMLSKDDLYYYIVKEVDEKQIQEAGRTVSLKFKKSMAKYVKVRITNSGIIPEGMHGAGSKAWLFIDEIQVL